MSKRWLPSITKVKRIPLLEQALRYRRKHPKEWQERQDEVCEESGEISQQETDRLSYIQGYYNEMEELKHIRDLKAKNVSVKCYARLSLFKLRRQQKQNKKN